MMMLMMTVIMTNFFLFLFFLFFTSQSFFSPSHPLQLFPTSPSTRFPSPSNPCPSLPNHPFSLPLPCVTPFPSCHPLLSLFLFPPYVVTARPYSTKSSRPLLPFQRCCCEGCGRGVQGYVYAIPTTLSTDASELSLN